MPEQREAHVSAEDIGPEPLRQELRHHRAEPDQPDRDVHAVAADQREERGEKRAAVRARALSDEKIGAMLAGKQIVKVIVVPGKLVNIVVR